MENSNKQDRLQEILTERAGMGFLARQFQRLMTGLPAITDQRPSSGPLGLLLVDLAILFSAALAAALLATFASTGGWALLALLPATFASMVVGGRLRKLTVGHMHETMHGVGYADWKAMGLGRAAVRRIRVWLAETCSIVALTVSATDYMAAHGRHHRLRFLGTIFEPDGHELAEEGFVRGLPKGSFKRQLALKVFNPIWYVRKNFNRLVQTFSGGKVIRRVAALVWFGILLGLLAIIPPIAWIFAIGMPWFIIYPAASLLQVITEHPYGDHHGASDLASYADRTWDRIPWDIMPNAGSSVVSWAMWWGRLITIHVPSRICVLDTTMIWHRWHHLAWPSNRAFDDWWNIGFAYRDAWQEGILPEHWQTNTLVGLPEALHRQEEHLETSDL